MGLQQTDIVTSNGLIPHYYLCNYLPVSAGKDTHSHSLLKFKRGLKPDLDGWIDCSLEMLQGVLLPGMTIIRALHHHEKAALDRPGALDSLGRALAERFQCHYRPGLLRKSRLTREIKGLSRDQREAELRDLYYYIQEPILPGEPTPSDRPATSHAALPTPPHILIIDDILTTATTVKKIMEAVMGQLPEAKFSVFTLTKADYESRLNQWTSLKGQNYQLEQGSDWVVAEEEVPSYYSPERLRSWILSDNWPPGPTHF